MSNKEVKTLTPQDYWEGYWNEGVVDIPEEVIIGKNKYHQSLYIPFYGFVKKKGGFSVLEIGGSPGLFVSSLTQIFENSSVGILDYSERGIEETKEVFAKFKIDGTIHQKDLFQDNLSDIPKYDLVYSLGFIEHYQDLENTLNKHLECAKSDGIIIIGLPVFLGLNKWLIKSFAPKNMTTWYPFIMDNKNWQQFRKRKDIKILFDGYVGGFNPHVHHRLEDKNSLWKKLLYVFLHKYFAKFWDIIPYTEKINSKYFSFYYYFVAQKIEESKKIDS